MRLIIWLFSVLCVLYVGLVAVIACVLVYGVVVPSCYLYAVIRDAGAILRAR